MAGVVGVAIVVELDEAVAVLEGHFPKFAVPEGKIQTQVIQNARMSFYSDAPGTSNKVSL